MTTRWQNLLRVLGRARRPDLAWREEPIVEPSDSETTDSDVSLD